MFFGGGKENRTPDPLLAKQMLSQLSYTPIQAKPISLTKFYILGYYNVIFECRVQISTQTRKLQVRTKIESLVGLGRLELPTLRLSGVRSNHLSYKPVQGPAPSSS